MARWLLLNHIIVDGAAMNAAREIDDLQYDVDRLKSAGGVLLKLPNAVVEARAAHVRLQQYKGRREAELDILTAAFAEYVNGAAGSLEYVGEELLGAIDGVNTVYTTASKFIHSVPGKTIRVYRNGVRQKLGGICDYTIAESGGVGTGYDLVTFATAPRIGEILIADYFPT